MEIKEKKSNLSDNNSIFNSSNVSSLGDSLIGNLRKINLNRSRI